MRKNIVRVLWCVALLLASVLNIHAENGIIETRHYSLCSGDTISIDTRRTPVSRDTILYDTIRVTDPDMDSIYVYVVNVYPMMIHTAERLLEAGQEIAWCDTVLRTGGTYERIYHSIHGCDSVYRIHVKVQLSRAFTLCDDESVYFNGQTYVNAGTYYNTYTPDTVYKITITKHPSQLHEKNGILFQTAPYYWEYGPAGRTRVDTLTIPGVYIHKVMNDETGCEDTWRLNLTRNENSYYFIENATVCENEEFEWHGKTGLNRLGIGTTSRYYDRHHTITGQDSIYELVLRVNPVPRVSRTIPFCGSIYWRGKEVRESTVAIDTLKSLQYGCDSIVTTYLTKGIAFQHHDSVSIYPGETMIWHNQIVNHDGLYIDNHLSVLGCDSSYTLRVGWKEASSSTNIRSYRAETCEGKAYTWRGKSYYNSGTYIDTIYQSGTTEIDSLYILQLVVNPIYSTRERITFYTFPASYRGWQFMTSGEEHTFRYTSAGGCDSLITVIAEQEMNRTEEWQTICQGTSYRWPRNGQYYSETGDYVLTIKDKQNQDSVEHVLHLNVRYIPDTYITRTICQGGSFTFGDQVLTQSGHYSYTFRETGCDSTVHLALNVLSADTNIVAHQMNEGDPFTWNGETYREAGVYYHYATNRYGCDSVSILELTINHVDTIDTVATVCPGEIPFVWHGISASQSGLHTTVEQQPAGDYNFYRLNLTVLPLVEKDTTLRICDDASIQFNGKTYSEGGLYSDYLACDTLMRIRIIKYPKMVHETQARLGIDGYTWTYQESGATKTETFFEPGTYEFESPNSETGCSEVWRLILTKDQTNYHFVETETICEGDDYSWRGLGNLSHQGIGETTHYFETYQTRSGNDSIYELILTVIPVERTVRTHYFCGETEYKGVTYTASTVIYDTIAIPNGCYRIERINLNKETPFYSQEAKEIPQGTVLHWHGQNITTDGTYYDYNSTVHGCDSIYEIRVTIIPASPETNQYAEELSACEGDTIRWRGKDIWRSGTYVDTVPQGATHIDSIFTLKFTVWPAPKDTIYQHLYTCGENASIRYNGQDYYQNETIVTTFHTIHGCDSTVKVYLHFNTALYLSDTVEISDKELPYRWTYRLADTRIDTVLQAAGTYQHITPAEGSCTNKEELVLIVYPTYLYEQDTTICETDLPFHWQNGPIEHRNDDLQHTIGETKQYEYRYTTVNNTDSIYRLNLTINAQPKRIQQYHFCEGENMRVNGKDYNDAQYIPGQVYRDTIYRSSTTSTICDSVIFLEITKQAVNRHYETQVLEVDQQLPIIWHGKKITQTGLTADTVLSSTPGECYSIEYLNLIQEQRETRTLCRLDTASIPQFFEWRGRDLKDASTGIYRDTVFDATGMMTDFYSLDLTIYTPVVKPMYIRYCKPVGEPYIWPVNGQPYDTDTLFRYILNCDTIYDVHIDLDTSYVINIIDTICEHELPYKLGRQHIREIWREGFYTHTDTTVQGCDSTINLTLRIIPSLTKNDSVFICEEEIATNPVILGNLVNPTFAAENGGPYTGSWEGKWKGIPYYSDTIVYNCDSSYHYHVIVRPRQKEIVHKEIFLCHDDSVQLFWPNDDTWFYKDTTYEERTTMDTLWTDLHHGYTYNDYRYTCDSVTIWHIKKMPLGHRDTTAHILLGDSIWWSGYWRYNSGTFDSIAPSKDTSFFGDTCTYIYSLHLIVDTLYHYRDTVELFCAKPNHSYSHTWADGYKQGYTVDNSDTTFRHYIDSLRTKAAYPPRDSIYDLVVSYHMIKDTLLFDTICEDSRYRFDSHRRTVERWLDKPGTYTDTIDAVNGCDSIITLQLFVRPRIVTTPQEVLITDREIPYIWHNDSLRATGLYTFSMTDIHGCDSIDSLFLTVHETHVFYDTIDICAPLNSSHKHLWHTGYVQHYTTPLSDGIAEYADTLQTRILLDSIYVLRVNFHQTYETLFRDTICEGERYRFDIHRGTTTIERWLTTAGTYRDTVETTFGCDSVLTLLLYVRNRVPVTHLTKHIADKEAPFLWTHTWTLNGTPTSLTDTLYATGEYEFRMSNIYGCDSIDSLHLFVHKTYNIWEDTINICHDETPYTWQDRNDIINSGTYSFHALTTDGYDSTRYVYIKVWPIIRDTVRYAICEGSDYLFKGERLTVGGTYRDTLHSHLGCDSIVTLFLTVNKPFYHRIDLSIYEGDTVIFEGYPYTQAGIYPAHYLSKVTGCDSIIELHLSVNKLYDDSVSVCYNSLPFVWRGQTIYESGIYRDTLVNTLGKETITGIKVTILPIARIEKPILDTICEGDFYTFNGQMLTEGGTYFDTLTAQNGCDSIVTLVLNVQPVKYQTEKKIIFEGDSILFRDGTYKHASGIYNYREPIADGKCADTYQLILTVIKPINIDTTALICENELPFTWRGHQYSEDGSYTVPVSWTDSTRITMTLHLTIAAVPRLDRSVDLCEGSTFFYKDREFRENTIFYDTIPTREGCDSIIRIIIRFHPTYDRIDTVHISDKQPYLFHGRTLTNSGTYEWTGQAAYGCDSIEHLVLVVHPSFFQTDTLEICQSDSLYPYEWTDGKGRTIATISQTGVYNDSVLTEYGFDSVHQLVVHVHPMYLTREQFEIGVGEVLKIHGRDISQPAIYYDTLRTIHGCDSIFHVVVNPKRTREFIWTREICQGEYYDFFGRKLTHSGQYKYTSVYQDSIVTLNLTVNPISITEQRVVITAKQLPYIMDGRMYEAAGVYNDTLFNHFGCDSILRKILVVTTHYSEWTPIPLCPGSEVKIDGDTITKAGLYSYLRRSRETGEMDSLYRVEVYDAPAFEYDVTRTICQGDTVFYGDRAITRGGHHDIVMKTVDGCDSIYHLDLTVNPTYLFITDTTIADYQKMVWHGKTYLTAGEYSLTWPTINDCDSTHTLKLQIMPTLRDTTFETICTGQQYSWRGHNYDKDGLYTDTVYMPEAGFSAIYSLRLIIAYPTIVTSASTGDVCADTDGFDVTFEYTGQKPLSYSIYFDALAKRQGFVDIIDEPLYGETVAHIDMPTFNNIAYETHPYYVRPDYYTMYVVLDNGVCGLSRSDSVRLLVKYPSWIIEQNWNDVVIPLKAQYNGGYEFAQMEWLVDGVVQKNVTTTGYLISSEIAKGSQVVLNATRKGESYAIPTCPLIIKDPVTTSNEVPVLVYPTQAPRHAPRITIEAPKTGAYEIYTATGLLVGSGVMTEGKTGVTLPATNGIFFIRTLIGNDVSSHKVLLY